VFVVSWLSFQQVIGTHVTEAMRWFHEPHGLFFSREGVRFASAVESLHPLLGGVEVQTALRVTGKSTVTVRDAWAMNHALFVLTAIYLFARKPHQTSRMVTYELLFLVDGMMSQGLREQNGCENTGWKVPTNQWPRDGGGGGKITGAQGPTVFNIFFLF